MRVTVPLFRLIWSRFFFCWAVVPLFWKWPLPSRFLLKRDCKWWFCVNFQSKRDVNCQKKFDPLFECFRFFWHAGHFQPTQARKCPNTSTKQHPSVRPNASSNGPPYSRSFSSGFLRFLIYSGMIFLCLFSVCRAGIIDPATSKVASSRPSDLINLPFSIGS